MSQNKLQSSNRQFKIATLQSLIIVEEERFRQSIKQDEEFIVAKGILTRIKYLKAELNKDFEHRMNKQDITPQFHK